LKDLPSSSIDLPHLSRQTLGDRDLEREILSMFVRQADEIVKSLPGLPPAERAALAHRLAGSARGIGAFALADCATGVEANPDDADRLERFRRLLGEARAEALVIGLGTTERDCQKTAR